jgi:hypothetical protein
MKPARLAPLAAACVLFVVSYRPAPAAPVTLDPATALRADVASALTPPGQSPAHNEDSDAGNAADPAVSAAATASLPAELTEPARQAAGTAKGGFTLSASQLKLTGGTTAAISPAASFTTDAETSAVASLDLPFTLATGSSGDLSWSIDIAAPVQNNEKVTVLLDRTGANASSLFAQLYTETATGTFPTLAAGTYRLRVVAGSEATNKGIAGESGSANFAVTFATTTSGGGTGSGGGSGNTAPLPSALGPGAAALAALFAAMTLQRRWFRI